MRLTIDGVEYDVKCRITREAEIRASDISGPMLNGVEFVDVQGTYMAYGVEFTYPLYSQGKYAMIYEALTQPVPSHVFVLPYNTGAIELTAKVELVYDELLELENGRTFWRAVRFDIQGIAPTKTMSLEEVVSRGLPALPDSSVANIGDTYTWTVDGWEVTATYADADLIAY